MKPIQFITYSLLFSTLCALTALGQGGLTPSLTPAPTMKSLDEIWGKIGGLETQLSQVQAENRHLNTLVNLLSAATVDFAWNLQIVDPEPNRGGDTSLAFDPSGQPAVSYYDEVNSALKYASFDGTKWTTTTVDGAGTTDVGRHSSLAFSPTGQPMIYYYNTTNGNL